MCVEWLSRYFAFGRNLDFHEIDGAIAEPIVFLRWVFEGEFLEMLESKEFDTPGSDEVDSMDAQMSSINLTTVILGDATCSLHQSHHGRSILGSSPDIEALD